MSELEPEPAAAAEQQQAPVDPTADTIRRQWADELWYRVLPYRGRP
jgi:hypothetical protein